MRSTIVNNKKNSRTEKYDNNSKKSQLVKIDSLYDEICNENKNKKMKVIHSDLNYDIDQLASLLRKPKPLNKTLENVEYEDETQQQIENIKEQINNIKESNKASLVALKNQVDDIKSYVSLIKNSITKNSLDKISHGETTNETFILSGLMSRNFTGKLSQNGSVSTISIMEKLDDINIKKLDGKITVSTSSLNLMDYVISGSISVYHNESKCMYQGIISKDIDDEQSMCINLVNRPIVPISVFFKGIFKIDISLIKAT